MATKSKKYDILSGVKIICFILALVFAVTGVLKISSIVLYLQKTDGYDAVWNGLIMQKEDYYCFESDKFNENISDFSLNAMKVSGLYSDPTKKGYDSFKKAVNGIYINNLINILLSENLEPDPYFIFYCLNHEYISLKKLADTSLWSDGFFLYDSNDTAFSADVSTGGQNGYATEAYNEDVTSPAPATTVMYELFDSKPSSTVPSYYISTGIYDYSDFCESLDSFRYNERFSVKNNIIYVDSMSDSLIRNAAEEKADLIVSLCPVYFGEKKTLYSGVYAVTLNRDKLNFDDPEEFISLKMSFPKTFDEYKAECYHAQKALKQYKNAYFFTYDNKTGTVISNITGEKITSLSDAYSCIEKKCPSSYIIFDEKAEEIVDFISYAYGSFSVSGRSIYYNNLQLLAGKDSYYCIGIDKTLSGGEDPFALIARDTAEIISTVKSAVPSLLICLFGFLISLFVLIFISGRKIGDGELYLMALDVIPTDLRIALNGGICTLAVYLTSAFIAECPSEIIIESEKSYSFIFGIRLLIAACAVLTFSSFIDLILYIARRVKDRSLLKNISLVILISAAVKQILGAVRKSRERPAAYTNVYKSVMKRVFLLFFLPNTVAVLVCIITDLSFNDTLFLLIPLIFIFFYNLIFIFRALSPVAGVNMIFDSLHQLRMGNNKTYLDPNRFPRLLKGSAEDLDKVSDGLSIAVENAVKEQKTKTELITNVSHDLKTPLTSIVSYVDLLSRCDIGDPEAQKYIGVLGEKSKRLKKLIEDLVEASKASTGNVNVCLVKMSLNELIVQILGEYDDDFEKKGLIPVLDIPPDDITVEADSKLSYRILDNLLSNVKKYSMPGTRVYITVSGGEKTAYVTLRNISEKQLNIPASALMERFVRGDESRSTEGSGLGLSIAESFSVLQNGALNIEINGDMFTATVEFKAI